MLKASKDLSNNEVSPSKALDTYCSLNSIAVEEQQFCYNIDPFKNEMKRLLDLGADSARLCKKVMLINKDFCSSVLKKETTIIKHEKLMRGIIYE